MPTFEVRIELTATQVFRHDVEVTAVGAPEARQIVQAAYDRYAGGEAREVIVQGLVIGGPRVGARRLRAGPA